MVLIDSNILIDLLDPKSKWFGWSQRQIVEARLTMKLCFNVVVASETAYRFETASEHTLFLNNFPAQFEDIPLQAAYMAADAHQLYRKRGGGKAQTLPDFLIGAHAAVQNYVVLTRDVSGFRSYFPTLDIIAPDTHP